MVPHPLVATFIFVAWLALAERVTPGQIALAAVAGVAGAWMMAALGLHRARPRAARIVLRLTRDVVIDIVRSNIAVARLALIGSAGRQSNFLRIPLDLRDRAGLAVLAIIITATPGTIWVSYNSKSGVLLLHILELTDEQSWTDTIKHRYERRLMEIFE
jgi:multicomponent K+:H+ antiporter subunit E